MARVLQVFLDDPAAPRYGLELMKTTGMPSGSLYPVLARLERSGWVRSTLEQVDPAAAGRPARRYYELTPDGIVQARYEMAAIAEAFRRPGRPSLGHLRPGTELS